MEKQYKKKWFQFDLARQRSFDREETEQLLEVLQKCGYNGIGLYLEGFFELPEFGGAAREGCMNKDDAKWISKTAAKYGLQVIPMTNLVGHGESFLSQERYTSVGRYCNNFQFDMKAEGFREFAKSVIDQYIECFNPSFIHIGGDEVSLSEEDRKDYAAFLSDMCSYLKEKGIETGIWGDMLYKHTEIGEMMTKDIWVFDWWYYGHRVETPKMLSEMGFKKIIVCPGTQSWNGIVATQFICPWRNDVPWKVIDVKPDEIEAFLLDSQPYDVYDTMLTDWENYQGHLMWNALHIMARFGNFVNGKDLSDEALNETLFGRQTPFMECMHLLMNVQDLFYRELEKLPGRFVTHGHGIDGVFCLHTLSKMLQCGERIGEDMAEEFIKVAQKVTEILEGWEAKTSLEDRCKRSIEFAVSYAKAGAGILKLANKTRALYRAAALEQFRDSKKYSSMLSEVQNDLRAFADECSIFKESLRNAVKDSGHTRADFDRLDKTKLALEKMANSLDNFNVGGSQYEKNIALISWQKLVFENVAFRDVNS